MNKYELVVLIDPRLPKSEMEKKISDVEGMLKNGILEKDDMGLLDLFHKIKGSDRAYFVSYYIEMNGEDVLSLKKELNITQGILRFAIYKMSDKQKFLKYAEANKMFELSDDEMKKMKNANVFQEMDSGIKKNKNKSK